MTTRTRINAWIGLSFVAACAIWSSQNVGAQPSSSNFYPVYAKNNLLANATTQVKTGSGVLHTLCINTKGAASNTVTVYDNTASSGTIIATIDTTIAPGCYAYDAAFGTGLRIVIATGTAADLTVTWRGL